MNFWLSLIGDRYPPEKPGDIYFFGGQGSRGANKGGGEARGARDTSSAPAGHLPLKGKAILVRAAAIVRTPQGEGYGRAVPQGHLLRCVGDAAPTKGNGSPRRFAPRDDTSSGAVRHLPLKGKAKGIPRLRARRVEVLFWRGIWYAGGNNA